MKNKKIAHTQALDDILIAVFFAEAAGDISLIYGEAGLGKRYPYKSMLKHILMLFTLN